MNREKLYWGLIGLFAVGLICLYIFWVHPIRVRVADERKRMADLRDRFKKQLVLQPTIPSAESLDEHARYLGWIKRELEDKVEPFFASSDATLDEPLVTDSAPVTPQRFNAAYLVRVDQVRKDVSRRAPGMGLPKALFPDYAWATGAGLPRTDDFPSVRKDTNIRAQLLDLLIRHKAAALTKIDISDGRMTQESWSLIPVTLDATVPAESATLFLRDLLQVDWRPGTSTRRLCVILRHLEMDRSERGSGNLDLSLRFDVVDFPDELRAKANGEGEK